jgi:phosphate:Na+ symporter
MYALVEENMSLAFATVETGTMQNDEKIKQNEKIINFTNRALTDFLIKLSADVEQSNERIIGSYFHVLNDLERIGDHAENFHEMGVEMKEKDIVFSGIARADILEMHGEVTKMFAISKDALESNSKAQLPVLTKTEKIVDAMKKDLTAKHFTRLAEGGCKVTASPYYSSLVSGLERVADHLVNIGYSIVNPTGSQKVAK